MAFTMKAFRSFFKLHKRTTSTASTERPSKTRTKAPTSLHIRKAQPSNEEAVAQTQHATSPGTLSIDGDANAAPTESQMNISPVPPVPHPKKNADQPQPENGDATLRSSVSGNPTIYNAVKVGMGLMKEVSTAFGPLEAVVRGLSFILEHHEKWAANKGVIKRLVCRIETLRTAFEEMGEGQSNDKNTQRRDALLRKLRAIAIDIETISNKHKLSSYIAAGADEDTLSALVNDIQDTLIDYQTITQIEIDARTAQLITAEEDRLLLQLPRAPDASHLSKTHKSCLKGTRTTLLSDVEAWSEDPESHSIFWLNGHAGSGKSTIIQSFCQDVFSTGRLGASFFCSATVPNRSNLRMIFPTLAFQLARRFPAFKERLVATLRYRPDVAQEPLETQFTELIVGPLEDTAISTLIVIDALDECQETESISTFLPLLPEYIKKIPSVKFFITARPEPPIRAAFRLPPLRFITRVVVLGDLEKASVDHDIYLFLKARLSDAMKGRSDVDLPSPWPFEHDLRILTAMSGQLFVFAATAAAFITSPYDQPAERLALLKAMPEKNRGIDQLYRTILMHGYGEIMDHDYQAKWRLVVASILLLGDPIRKTRGVLAAFLNLEASKIASILRPLHAVIKITEDGRGGISIYHKSFYDYLTDPARCTDSMFFIDYGVHHALLAMQCIWFMSNSPIRDETWRRRYQRERVDETSNHMVCLLYSADHWSSFHLLRHGQMLDTNVRLQLLSTIEEFLETKMDIWVTIQDHRGSPLGSTGPLKDLDHYISNMPENLLGRDKFASVVDRTLRVTADLEQKKWAARSRKGLEEQFAT